MAANNNYQFNCPGVLFLQLHNKYIEVTSSLFSWTTKSKLKLEMTQRQITTYYFATVNSSYILTPLTLLYINATFFPISVRFWLMFLILAEIACECSYCPISIISNEWPSPHNWKFFRSTKYRPMFRATIWKVLIRQRLDGKALGTFINLAAKLLIPLQLEFLRLLSSGCLESIICFSSRCIENKEWYTTSTREREIESLQQNKFSNCFLFFCTERKNGVILT